MPLVSWHLTCCLLPSSFCLLPSSFYILHAMKIVHLAAGAGGMYCGSCLHGNRLAAALQAAGEDVLLVPLYTPIRTDEENVSFHRLAFGGINVFLQGYSAVFRHTPRLLDRMLDQPWLLRWVAKGGSRTRAEQLGKLTVSMLRGEEGYQRKELQKLVDWLTQEIQPEVIHLSSVLLVGMARELNRRLHVPVVCTLSGEDFFLEKLPQPHYGEARALLCERSADAAALVAMNCYYADFMAEYLGAPHQWIHVIPPGLNLEGHGKQPPSKPRAGPVTIGYLARVCPEKGLHLLAEALRLLAEDAVLPPLRLHAAGYLDKADRPYLGQIQKRLVDCGLGDRFQYVGELDRAAKIAFLQTLDLMSVPTVYRESKGLYVLEAWANAVPVVLPAHGAFPELIQDTGGGLLCEPDDPPALAAALKRLILDPAWAAESGRRAQQAVHQRYNAQVMARQTIELYREVCGRW
jgi:glycosyltransferase involved in cell wall biosynthesis